MSCSGESIDVDVEFCVCGELVVFLPFVLMSLNPLGLEGSSEFFIEFFDDGQVVGVVWLFSWSVVLANSKGDTVDRDPAIH